LTGNPEQGAGTENPEQGAGKQSGGRQNGPRSRLHSKLTEDEDRLRKLVAGYNLDPETINEGILDTMRLIHAIL
jgi:hypothetical protein